MVVCSNVVVNMCEKQVRDLCKSRPSESISSRRELQNLTSGLGHAARSGDLLPYLSATTDRARAGIHATDHTPQRQPTTEEDNLSGPIRTGHNQHTHTGHTRQPEPQLKGFSCSSAIPSHNSREAIPSHNSRNTTCLTAIPSHNSRDTFRATTQGTPATSPLKHYQKPCRTPYEVHQLGLTAAKSPSGGHVPLGATASRPPGGCRVPPGAQRLKTLLAAGTAWREVPHRQAPENQVPPCLVTSAWRSPTHRQAAYQ
ncbi:hypothetical protein DEO72_LG10g1631 [Vigna unguiculata]|uniref:Uncharacterized protein n=1 Tax=Vigna unguiculata TaxID=3917 RepID=A0A4D6NBY9_VIGUN|nr:hypothetical protein DEO72_LG10g1631 [Vigna unguiculata]